MNLRVFLAQVDAVIDFAIANAGFHPLQEELLNRTVRRYRPLSASDPMSDPTWRSTVYLIVRAWGRVIDSQVIEATAFSSLYLLAADLMDDVQDEDLAGKPHEQAGAAQAINDSVALLFLALERLARVTELEVIQDRRLAWLRLFNVASLRAVAGQHRDLLGAAGAERPLEVLEMVEERNSSLSMIMEFAALLGRCSMDQVSIYRTLGAKITTYCQIREDLSDIFGKALSPDLGTRKMTYPVACFFDAASPSERAEFERLLLELPRSLQEIRVLLYESGAVDRAADTMERLREEIHETFALLGNPCAAHRCLLNLVDSFAESVYEPPVIESTRTYLEPDGPWHDWVRAHLELFVRRMQMFDVPGTPSLRPWHFPQWMYEPNRNVIYYPDFDGLAEDIAPEYGQLLGIDETEAMKLQWTQAPALIAHEMFHYWRGAHGRLTNDYWHEEWVANTLAVGYVRQFEPEALAATMAMADRVLSGERSTDYESSLAVLETCAVPHPGLREGYDMSASAAVHVTLAMLRRIVAAAPGFESSIAELLSVRSANLGVAAA